MENMDANVITTSLPAIAADLNTSPVALKLAMTSYLVSLSVFIPISGWMADRFTARNVFRLAIAVFMVGSILCALSFSLTSFVMARFLQGVGGAMMTPVGRLVLLRSTPKNELVLALSWLSIPALVGPLLGPPIGGFITTYTTWHWIFLINVPIGIAGIIMADIYLPRNEVPFKRRLDWLGFLLSGLSLSLFIFGLSLISLPGLGVWIGLVMSVFGFILGYLYVRHARVTPHPLLDLKLFKDAVFRKSIVGGSIFRLGIGALPFLLPLMLQLSFGLSPLQSGMITFVGAIGSICMKLGVNRFYNRFGFRSVLMNGSLVCAVFMATNGFFTSATPYWIILSLLLIGGFLRSLLFSGVNALSYGRIAPEQMSQAAPISAVAQQASLALGVALAGAILEVCVAVHGGGVRLTDFQLAFFAVAMISGLSFFDFKTLPIDAGDELKGMPPQVIETKDE